jgi:membrane protein
MNADRPAPQTPDPALNANAEPAPAPRQPGLPKRLIRTGTEHAANLVARAEPLLPVRCLRRFAAVNGQDRALVLGGQAFTTLIPLLIVMAAAAPQKSPTALADQLVTRFHVTGSSAQAIRTLFERPPGATGTITIAGLVVMLFSLLSLARYLQRTYEAAWHLPPMGVRGTLNGMTATGLFVASLLLLSLLVGLLRNVPAGSVLAFLLRIVSNTAIWLVLQSLLLSRRVPIRRLLPGAVVIAVGSAILSLYSALWMPRVIESNAAEYGIIGITFALLTWLIVVGLCLVVAAVISAEIGGAPKAQHRPVIPDSHIDPTAQQSAVRPGRSLGADEDGAGRREAT